MIKGQGSTLIVYADFTDEIPNIESQRFNETTNVYLNNNYGVFHVLASSKITEMTFHLISESHFLLVRPNLGYDFGSWAQSIDYPDVLQSFQILVFTNSSLHGPFVSPTELIQALLSLKCDVKAAVESFQITPHFQSYMWAIEAKTLYGSEELLKFFVPFKNMEPDREAIIRNGELTLPMVLKQSELTYQCLFPAGSLCSYHENPSLDAAERLMNSGFPYLKKALTIGENEIQDYRKMIKKYFPKSAIQI
jgi:hypothetical protein